MQLEEKSLPRPRLLVAAAVMTALVFCACLLACKAKDGGSAGKGKVTIAVVTLPEAALAQVAESEGLFRQEGLDATVHRLPYGKIALQELLDGKADFATVAETPLTFAVMKGAPLAVIATVSTSDVGHAVVARKDSGISSIGDLSGKRIGQTAGTTSQFFLNAILALHGVSMGDVKVVDLKAEELPDALARGQIDAASTFALYTAEAEKMLGGNCLVFHDKDIYRSTFNVVATRDFIAKNRPKVRSVLRALLKAEEDAKAHPARAQEIVAGYSGISSEILQNLWPGYHYAVGLDQTLILALEDQSAWAMKNGLAKRSKIPDYLNYIDMEDLSALKPEAVEILR